MKKKRYVALAHADTAELTYRNVEMPTVVPLYQNFNTAKQIGTARLRRKGERIFAIMEINFAVADFDKMPIVILGVEAGHRVTENDVCYLVDGIITAASIVNSDIFVEGEIPNVG